MQSAPAKLTTEQWKQIEICLSASYGHAELLCDGYKLDLNVEKLKGLRYTIVVYVNGAWGGARLREDTEERRKFWRPVTTCYARKKFLDPYRKAFGKKAAEAWKVRSTGTYWLPDWPNFKRLRAHLNRNCVSIELIKVGYV